MNKNRNPNFFGKAKKSDSESNEIKIEDSKLNTKEYQETREQKRIHNFNFEENKNFEDTPDFVDAAEKLSEEEKRMELSNDKMDETSEQRIEGRNKPIITFNVNDAEEEGEDEEELPEAQEIDKEKKHKFNSAFEENLEDVNTPVQDPEFAEVKVEETPEEQNVDEKDENEDSQYVVGERPRMTPVRKYKEWNKKNNPLQDEEHKEYSSISERIGSRGQPAQEVFQPESYLKPVEDPVYGKHNPVNESENIPAFKQESSGIEKRFSEIKNQFSGLEKNIEQMTRESDFYKQNKERQEIVRHTINLPSASYNYGQQESLGVRNQEGIEYGRGESQVFTQNNSESKTRISHVAANPQPIEMNTNPIDPSGRRSEFGYESPGRNMLQEQMNMMKDQQDKILENQNIFQTYITNEITQIKNRLNQIESDFLLSKTLSNPSGQRNISSLQSHNYS